MMGPESDDFDLLLGDVPLGGDTDIPVLVKEEIKPCALDDTGEGAPSTFGSFPDRLASETLENKVEAKPSEITSENSSKLELPVFSSRLAKSGSFTIEKEPSGAGENVTKSLGSWFKSSAASLQGKVMDVQKSTQAMVAEVTDSVGLDLENARRVSRNFADKMQDAFRNEDKFEVTFREGKLGMELDMLNWAKVLRVVDHSQAAELGVQVGDRIVAICGTPVPTCDDPNKFKQIVDVQIAKMRRPATIWFVRGSLDSAGEVRKPPPPQSRRLSKEAEETPQISPPHSLPRSSPLESPREATGVEGKCLSQPLANPDLTDLPLEEGPKTDGAAFATRLNTEPSFLADLHTPNGAENVASNLAENELRAELAQMVEEMAKFKATSDASLAEKRRLEAALDDESERVAEVLRERDAAIKATGDVEMAKRAMEENYETCRQSLQQATLAVGQEGDERLQNLSVQLAAEQEEKHRFQQEFAALEITKRDIEQSLASAHSDFDDVRGKLTRSAAELEKKIAHASELERVQSLLKESKDQLSAEAAAERLMRAKADGIATSLKAELQADRQKFSQREISLVEETRRKVDSELSAARSEGAQAAATASELLSERRKLAETKGQLSALRQTFQDMQESNAAEGNTRVVALSSQLDAERAGRANDSKQFQKELSKAKKELESSAALLKDIEGSHKEARTEAASIQQRHDQLQGQLVSSNAENNTLNTSKIALESERDSLRTALLKSEKQTKDDDNAATQELETTAAMVAELEVRLRDVEAEEKARIDILEIRLTREIQMGKTKFAQFESEASQKVVASARTEQLLNQELLSLREAIQSREDALIAECAERDALLQDAVTNEQQANARLAQLSEDFVARRRESKIQLTDALAVKAEFDSRLGEVETRSKNIAKSLRARLDTSEANLLQREQEIRVARDRIKTFEAGPVNVAEHDHTDRCEQLEASNKALVADKRKLEERTKDLEYERDDLAEELQKATADLKSAAAAGVSPWATPEPTMFGMRSNSLRFGSASQTVEETCGEQGMMLGTEEDPNCRPALKRESLSGKQEPIPQDLESALARTRELDAKIADLNRQLSARPIVFQFEPSESGGDDAGEESPILVSAEDSRGDEEVGPVHCTESFESVESGLSARTAVKTPNPNKRRGPSELLRVVRKQKHVGILDKKLRSFTRKMLKNPMLLWLFYMQLFFVWSVEIFRYATNMSGPDPATVIQHGLARHSPSR